MVFAEVFKDLTVWNVNLPRMIADLQIFSYIVQKKPIWSKISCKKIFELTKDYV